MSNTLKASIYYIVALLTFVFIRILSCYGAFSSLTGFVGDLEITLIIQVLCLFIIPFGLYRLISGEKLSDTFSTFKYKAISLKSILLCFCLGIFGYIINFYVSTFWSFLLSLFGYASRSSGSSLTYTGITDLIISLVSTALLPALFEEFLHRGLFQNLIEKDEGKICAVILTGILFGLFHLNIYQTGYATIIGIIMGFSVIFSGSIIPAIIIHFSNNAINVLYGYFYSTNDVFKEFLNNAEKFITDNTIIVCAISIVFLMLVMYLFFIITLAIMHNENKIFKKINFKDFALLVTGINYKTNFNQEISDNDEETTKNAKMVLFELYNIFHSEKQKTEFGDYIVLVSIVLLSTLITISTFIWGIL